MKQRLNRDGTPKEREVKSISFDVTDPFETKLLDYAEEQGVFSRYIKRLIMLDMHEKENPGNSVKFTPFTPVWEDEAKKTKAEENMKSLL